MRFLDGGQVMAAWRRRRWCHCRWRRGRWTPTSARACWTLTAARILGLGARTYAPSCHDSGPGHGKYAQPTYHPLQVRTTRCNCVPVSNLDRDCDVFMTNDYSLKSFTPPASSLPAAQAAHLHHRYPGPHDVILLRCPIVPHTIRALHAPVQIK